MLFNKAPGWWQFIKKDSITGFFLCVLLNFEEHQQATAFVTGKRLCWTLILIQVADPQRKWFPHKTKFLPNLKTFLYFARCPHCEAVAVLSSALLDSEAATRVFCKKGILRNFQKFTGKHLCQSLSFNKVAGLRFATLLKKRLWHRCFPVNFVKFLRTTFSQNTSGRLLLWIFWLRYSFPYLLLYLCTYNIVGLTAISYLLQRQNSTFLYSIVFIVT